MRALLRTCTFLSKDKVLNNVPYKVRFPKHKQQFGIQIICPIFCVLFYISSFNNHNLPYISLTFLIK